MTDTNSTAIPTDPMAVSDPTQHSTNANANPPLSSSNPFVPQPAADVPPATAVQPPSSTLSAAEPTPNPLGQDAAQRREAPADPRVAALRAMFPDYDDIILQSVLESVGGNQDHAIDTLLGMSDPDYRSDARPAEEPVLSQTDLDEQLARRLLLEDQEQQQQAWQAQQQRLPPRPRFDQQQQQQQSQGTGGNANGDTMGEFQQQFNKIAETGKKTFGNIFSKVKAKIQELDQPRSGQGSNPSQGSNSGTQPTWGGAGAYERPPSNQQVPYPSRQQSYPSPQQQPAYYDPNPQTAAPYLASSPSPPARLSPQQTGVSSTVQGYDATPDPPAANHTTSTVPAQTPPTNDTPRPPQTGSGPGQGTPIDGGRLGLLPKRPVSLMRSQSPPAGGDSAQHQLQRKSSEDDSDGLEYVENPFEESKK